MTLDELKIEAKAQGYRLVKIPESVRQFPCPVCGAKRTNQWYGPLGAFRKCENCDFRGYSAKTDREVKKKWNEAVMNYKERNDIYD